MMRYINSEIFSKIRFRKNDKDKFYQDIITFDIETTSYNDKISFMYAFAINVNGYKYYGRTWKEFKNIIDTLNKMETSAKFLIWVHNLSFEFRFMESVLKFDKVFAVSPHKVIYADCGNVRFRCSYFMSQLPLAELYKSYNLNTPKLKGELNYTLIRHKSTYLEKSELDYIENDVQLLYEYIEYMLKECGSFSPAKMPLTSTGFTRKYLKEKAYESNVYGVLRTIVKEASPVNMSLYNLLRRAFAGGYVHANWIWLKQVITNVKSLDKKSFYPALMCKEKFPRKFIKMRREKFHSLVRKDYALVFDICFYDIEAVTNHTTISKHKCAYIKNEKYYYNRGHEKVDGEKPPIFDNGRVRKAEILVTTITDLDYDTICKFYTFKSFKIGSLYASRKRYLPKVLIETVLDLYEMKTKLRDIKGEEIMYMELKKKLNSLFGVCVTDILMRLILYNQEDFTWENEDLKGDELLKYRNNNSSILLYQTGVWITAYARHEILDHVRECGDDNIYNDTDSVKLVNYEKHKKYFDKYNEKVKKQLYDMCDYYNIDRDKLNPVDIKGRHHFLGTLADEGTYTKFKTLGCKRYIYEINNELHSVVAGMPKENMVRYLLKFKNPFDAFNNKLVIPANDTGKNTHYYTSPQNAIEIIDYNGIKEVQEIGTGISLIPQKFEMNISYEFRTFLEFGFDLDISHQERLKNIREITKVGTLWE